MNKYPECEKLHAVHEESQKLGYFLDWLMSRYALAEWNKNIHARLEDKETGDTDYWNEILMPVHIGENKINSLLAEYFGIDLDTVEEERRQILEELRKANKD
jgi:hypothetical protein